MRGWSGVPVIEAIPFTYIHLLHNLYLISVLGSFSHSIYSIYPVFLTWDGKRFEMVWFIMLSYLRWVKIWSYLDFRYSRRHILRDRRPCSTTVSALHHSFWIFTDPPWEWDGADEKLYGGQIHESTILLRFLVIILRVLRLEVSIPSVLAFYEILE